MNDTDYPICSIYVCSSKNYRKMWKSWKNAGWSIHSSWITDKETTAEQRIYEARVSKALILWYPGTDDPPHEYMYEVGAAIAGGRDVIFAEGATSHPLASHHAIECIEKLEDAMAYAHGIIDECLEIRKTWIETYCGHQFRCNTRNSNSEEADVIGIWATPEMRQSQIILPWPSGAEFAAKICGHIDAAMVAGYLKGEANEGQKTKGDL